MDDVSDSEKTPFINAPQSKKQHQRSEVLVKYIRFVSAEIVVFSFIFVFYYYQNFTQQYLFQWFASEALNNATYSDSHGAARVCYNQTLINKLSGSNSTIDEVEGKAAHMNLMILLATYIPSLIINIVISPLSDKYGRKPAMIMVVIGEACAIVLSVIITYLALDVYWFILSGFLLGLSGGVSTLMSVSFAYISDITRSDITPLSITTPSDITPSNTTPSDITPRDITPRDRTRSDIRPPQQRTIHLGFLQGVVYISIALSSGIFNVWLEGTNCDFKPPSWLMVAVVLVGLVYSLIMPESLSKQKRVQSKKGMSVLLQGIQLFFWPRLKYSMWMLWFVTLSIFVVVFGESGENAITTLFLLHKPLEWNRALIGIYLIVRSISHALALFLLLPLFKFCFKFPDPVVIFVGLFVTVGANVFLGFVKSTWEMYVVGLLQGMESLLLPTLLSMSSNIVEEENQGALFSISSTFSLFAALLGSTAYSLVYPYTLKHGLPPGSSYWLMALILTTPVPLLGSIWIFGRRKPTMTNKINVVTEASKMS